uniref:Uncharacterized protein n=1 Tax=Rhizophora mucronata TaxID=61149 RepID=A0A2P2JYD1_RHIMU
MVYDMDERCGKKVASSTSSCSSSSSRVFGSITSVFPMLSLPFDRLTPWSSLP